MGLGPSCSSVSALVAFLAIVVAVVVQQRHKALFSGVDAPPPDFGTGSMFDSIATRYDTVNRVLALGMDIGWRKEMVQAIQESLEKSESTKPLLLDVATGTADVALLLAKAMPEATVIGVDPSPNMLDIGREKIRDDGLQNVIYLQVADAQELASSIQIPDEVQSRRQQENGLDTESPTSFDGATMSFGIRNVPDREKALCQIHQLLKPSSRFCILEFSEPDDSFGFLGSIARVFIRNAVPFLGGVLSGKPREYWHLQNSIKDFPSPNDFVNVLESLDCQQNGRGRNFFKVEELRQLNFGSVQLYIMRTVKEEAVSE